jgi:hypothetical protein
MKEYRRLLITSAERGLDVRVLDYRSEVLVRFPALLDFLRISGSGTGPTQPRE